MDPVDVINDQWQAAHSKGEHNCLENNVAGEEARILF